MKKTFLFLMMTLLFCIGSSAFNDIKAQDVVTIGDPETSITKDFSPSYNYQNSYSVSQQIYLKDEIGRGGTITHIAFQINLNETEDRNIVVYMKETDSNVCNTNQFETVEDKDIVFSGSHLFKVENEENHEWNTIELSTDFEYSGSKNICIIVNDITGAKGKTGNSFYYSATSDEQCRAMYANNNKNPYDASLFGTPFVVGETLAGGYRGIAIDDNDNNIINNIQFTFDGESGGEGGETQTLTLSVDKNTIKADGTEVATFNVELNDEELTEGYTIYEKIGTGGNPLSDNTFSTTTAGTYTFYAKYGELTSEDVTINAEYSIYISVDKNTFVADGSEFVTFTLKQGTGTNEKDITNDTDVTFYVDDSPIGGHTFNTTTAKEYQAYATKGEDFLVSGTVSFTATEPESEESEGNGETIYNTDGSVTYNKGLKNEYTLIIDMTTSGGEKGIILEDNVNFSWGGPENCGYVQDNTNKPDTVTPLTIPAYVLNGTTKWIPVTEIADYAFDSWTKSLTDLPENEIEPGNEKNDLFTSLVIPNTVTKIGSLAFSCKLEGPIFCYNPTPPTCEVLNNTYFPFMTYTYEGAILYVPAGSEDDYREATGWSRFETIAPLTIPTFMAKEDNNWNNANNWRRYTENGDGSYTEEYGVMPNAGEDVLINGKAIIPAGYTANVGAINIVSGGITIEDGGQLIHTNAGVSVTVEKGIKGYNATREGIAWNTISSPIAVMTPTSNVSGLLNGAYDLYYYDEPTHYWINHEQETNNFTTLDAGRGYLYANENNVTLKFNGVINYDNVSFDLDASSEYERLRGFNLIGNPFTHDIYMGSNIYSENLVIDGYYSLSQEGQWGAKKASSIAIAPCQGILVQTREEETINIVKAAPAPARSAQAALNITVVNEQYEDNAYVLFKEGRSLNKINHMNENIPMVYVIDNNEKFAIANIDDANEIALGFEAMTMGEYTIAVKAQDCKFNNMILTDNITGEKTNLLTDSYTFMATTNDEPNRFTLTLNNDNDNDADFIYINNNEMIINNIEGNGLVQIYDMMGRSVATYNVSGSANISMETLSEGVYIVRMTDANGVKTQKVVNN